MNRSQLLIFGVGNDSSLLVRVILGLVREPE